MGRVHHYIARSQGENTSQVAAPQVAAQEASLALVQSLMVNQAGKSPLPLAQMVMLQHGLENHSSHPYSARKHAYTVK
jgi:hypothetical protein